VGTFQVPKFIQDIAKALDTPELRDLYRRQQNLNPNLNQDCEELGEEIEQIFDHLQDSFDGKK